MPFQNNVLAGASGATGYQIPYSLRFRRSNSPYMTRTAGTPTNAKIATWSFWHKRGALGPEWVWGQITSGASTFFTFDSGIAATLDSIRIYVSGTNLTSTPVFRDPSAWYHFVVAVDTTQATAADRIKVYVNNQAVTMSGTITLNADITFNVSGKLLKIGDGTWFATSADYIDGYLAEFNFIDGQALTPSSFGQTDATTGVWVPKKYSGTYGNNGFYLKFADATTTTTIGNDSSGNANNWTTSGISVTSGVTFDQMTDTPTLNYATGNAVFIPSTNFLVDFRAANLEWGQAASNKNCSGVASIEMRTGKWYWETTVGTVAGNITFGVSRSDLNSTFRGTGTVYYRQDGQKIVDGVNSAYGASYVANDVLGFAYDADAGTLTCYKNNASQGTITITSGSSYGWFPACALDNAGAGVTAFHTFNFGQRAFSYTPPSGFKALNSANLPTPSIKKGSLYMNATLRTGTGATASVSSLGFQPDLVWIKSRSAATDHGLYDAVRGVQKQLESNNLDVETTEATGLTAFSSNGYTVGALAQLNTNTATYVDWAWKEGVTPGFDIVAFTGNGSAQTINHGLNAVPHMMVVKNRTGVSRQWSVYHRSISNSQNGGVYLNLTNGWNADSTLFNNTAPTSSQFTVGTYYSAVGETIIAYLWSEIEGFSKFGSYTGNGSTDGPFVWCGHRPRWLMIKRTDTTNDWEIVDTARGAYNVNTAVLAANSSSAESAFTSGYELDVLSNGFKLRSTGVVHNASGGTYIFAAFAENPFKYARAR